MGELEEIGGGVSGRGFGRGTWVATECEGDVFVRVDGDEAHSESWVAFAVTRAQLEAMLAMLDRAALPPGVES